ncbi:hypothetical protein [Nocardia sp. bgisy134]|uniref:hypothetical protein n=1 Tax=unclassified Nocardia TaxID=2637762 RepID=UPI003D7137F9
MPIYVILDNLSANKTPRIRSRATENSVELCFTPTSASWANPIEAQFGPAAHLRHGRLQPPQPSGARRPPVGIPALAQRQRPTPRCAGRPTSRTRIRGERQRRWGRPRTHATAA